MRRASDQPPQPPTLDLDGEEGGGGGGPAESFGSPRSPTMSSANIDGITNVSIEAQHAIAECNKNRAMSRVTCIQSEINAIESVLGSKCFSDSGGDQDLANRLKSERDGLVIKRRKVAMEVTRLDSVAKGNSTITHPQCFMLSSFYRIGFAKEACVQQIIGIVGIVAGISHKMKENYPDMKSTFELRIIS